MSTLRLVADDLTGALDTGAQFTGLLGHVPCAPFYPATWSFGDHNLAINLASRDGGEEEAARLAIEAALVFYGARIAFEKVDSLLRGHWAAEMAALAAHGRFRTFVFSPAFPAQGRITRDGRQWLQRGDGGWEALPIDLRAELERRGFLVASVQPDEVAAVDTDRFLVLCDAETESDLNAIVTAASVLPKPILWSGAAGLAGALSGCSPVTMGLSQGSRLAIIGTHRPISREQVRHFSAHAPHLTIAIDDNPYSAAIRINDLLERWGCGVLLALSSEAVPRDVAGPIIARRLKATLPLISIPKSLVVAGGETLLAVCRSLSTDGLSVEGQVRPGLPVSRMFGGLWDGTLLLSKSGAFGGPTLLTNLLLDKKLT